MYAALQRDDRSEQQSRTRRWIINREDDKDASEFMDQRKKQWRQPNI